MDDLIRRQDVLDLIEDMTDQFGVRHRIITEGVIELLPSVKPQEPKIVPIAVIKFDDDKLHEIVEEAVKNIEIEPKTGHWIAIDEEPHEDYECDKCGYVVSTYTANIEPHTEYKYCPNCGCRMVNPQESEEV